MERRGFLKLFGGAVAGIALEQAIPLGRVWSFPKKIVVSDWAVPKSTFITVRELHFQNGDIVTIAGIPRNFVVLDVKQQSFGLLWRPTRYRAAFPVKISPLA